MTYLELLVLSLVLFLIAIGIMLIHNALGKNKRKRRRVTMGLVVNSGSSDEDVQHRSIIRRRTVTLGTGMVNIPNPPRAIKEDEVVLLPPPLDQVAAGPSSSSTDGDHEHVELLPEVAREERPEEQSEVLAVRAEALPCATPTVNSAAQVNSPRVFRRSFDGLIGRLKKFARTPGAVSETNNLAAFCVKAEELEMELRAVFRELILQCRTFRQQYPGGEGRRLEIAGRQRLNDAFLPYVDMLKEERERATRDGRILKDDMQGQQHE